MSVKYKTLISNIFIALCFIGIGHLSAFAKQPNHKTAKKHIKGILKDTAAVMNFKVCKNDNGYVICGETPGNNNSTFNEPIKSKKYPAYEVSKSDVINLKGKPEVPKVQFPLSKPAPETQSGAWFGINSWNGSW